MFLPMLCLVLVSLLLAAVLKHVLATSLLLQHQGAKLKQVVESLVINQLYQMKAK